jgi:hypothetical protein
MLEFESRFKLYDFLSLPNLPTLYWSDGAGWIMAEHMYSCVQDQMKAMIQAASYIAVTTDETSACDNHSYIVVHVYVIQNWARIPLLITLQKLESDGANADNLTFVIMGVVAIRGGLQPEEVIKKLLCFGADGVSAFQGKKTGVTKQIQSKHAPFVMGVHCMAHRIIWLSKPCPRWMSCMPLKIC